MYAAVVDALGTDMGGRERSFTFAVSTVTPSAASVLMNYANGSAPKVTLLRHPNTPNITTLPPLLNDYGLPTSYSNLPCLRPTAPRP